MFKKHGNISLGVFLALCLALLEVNCHDWIPLEEEGMDKNYRQPLAIKYWDTEVLSPTAWKKWISYQPWGTVCMWYHSLPWLWGDSILTATLHLVRDPEQPLREVTVSFPLLRKGKVMDVCCSTLLSLRIIGSEGVDYLILEQITLMLSFYFVFYFRQFSFHTYIKSCKVNMHLIS